MKNKIRSLFRRWRAAWRDTSLLLRDFRTPLALFLLLIVGGGLLHFYAAEQAGEQLGSPIEAIYLALTMVFLQTNGDFPSTWYLQIFYFAMPLLGIVIIAQGLTEFALVFFNRRSRSKEWQMAVASTFGNHIVLIGLGHLGHRVVRQLREMNQEVVVVDLHPRDDLIVDLQKLDVPILAGDATREAMLDAAGIKRAQVLVLCTQNDNLNMQIAVKARSLNPDIRVVMRIFDDDFAQALEKQFGFSALSATSMAAPAFAATAAGMDISNPITVDGESLSLARLDVTPKSKLVGMSVGDAEQHYNISVVQLVHDSQRDMHPAADIQLCEGDTLAILGGPKEINHLVQENR
ncbi:MAG: NAD-binding protein [Nitrospirae bacterium]|nr:NAD-binding protein [Nitrospirota bacterium]